MEKIMMTNQSRSLRRGTTRMLAAACAGAGLLMINSLAFPADPASPPAGQPIPQAQQEQQQPTLAFPEGFKQVDLTSEGGIKTGLVKMTERALTKGDYNSFLAELALQDRERAREFKNPHQASLDRSIDQITDAWKTKYGEDFAINDKNLVFNDQFQIIQGQVSDQNVAINNWPVSATGGTQAAQAADQSPAIGDVNAQISASKLSNGRDVALVLFPGTNHERPLIVSMIFHYPLFWRVDVPNDRTGEQIFNDLNTQLSYLASHQNEWPSDKLEAYRYVAHHVAAALYGCEAPGNMQRQ
jgi:hypothetical protein